MLTGEGIANLYYSAEQFGLSSEWLENNVHHEIPAKYQYMTRANLVDTLQGLKQFHKNSPYLSLVEQELARRPDEKWEYVVRQPN